MNNQQAVVDQIVQNLAFEVEAVPKNELIQTTSMSQSAPLSVKIKVRKKDEIHMRNDVSIADNTSKTVQKVRLVNSDRTIMTFDVFMEAEFEKKPSRKLRKHIFDMLRPGICLGAVDDDECPYMPSSSYSANIPKPSVATKSDGILKQTFTLSKNVYQNYTVSTQPVEQKWLFGTCKPGGCLDPPFGEDKYSYKPSTRSGPERQGEERLEAENIESDTNKNKKPSTVHDEETQNNGRQSSIFDSGLFKKKRKSSDKSTNTKLPDKTDSIVDIFQGESATNSASTHSNPIITYPPKRKSDLRISDDKAGRSRGPSEDRPRKSFNDHSEPYFTRPKGVQRIKEKDTLDPNDQPKPRSSDAADLKKLPKESFQIPVPTPIPIPVPMPTISSKRKPEDIATNYDIEVIEKESISELKLQDQELHDQEPQSERLQDQELHGTINLKDTEILPRLLRSKSASGNTDDKPVESPKTSNLIPFSDIKPTAPNGFDTLGSSISIEHQSLNETKLQPLNAKETDNNIEDTAQPEFLKIPVTVPFHLDTHFEDSKGMQQNIEPELEKNESFANTSESNIETDVIPANFLTRGGFSDQGNDTEIPVTLDPIMEKDIKQDSEGEKNAGGIGKPARETDVIEKVSTATKYTQEDMARDSQGEEITNNTGKPLEQKYTQKDKKRDSYEGEDTGGIEKPARPSKIKDRTIIPTKYTEKDIKRNSKEDEITDEKQTEQQDTQDYIKSDSEGEPIKDAIKTPIELRDIEGTAIIPTKYTEKGIKRDSKEDEITDEKQTEQQNTQDYIKLDSEGEPIKDAIKTPTELRDIEGTAIIPTKYTEKGIKRDSKEDEITDEKQTEQQNTQDYIKPDSEGEPIKDAIKTPTELKDIEGTAIIPTKYIEKDIKRNSKEDEITDEKQTEQQDTQDYIKPDSEGEPIKDAIKTPTELKDIEGTAIIPTKYIEKDIKRDSKEDEITDEIEKQTEQQDTQDYIKPDSEGEPIKDAIKTPTKLKDITGAATISTQYIDENDVKRDSEAEAITNGIVKPANQEAIKERYIGDKATTATKYEENVSDIYGMPDVVDTQQVNGTPKEDDQKDSEIISLSKLKKSDSPDKYWDDIGHGESDLDIHKDKTRSFLLSESENETDTWDKRNKPYSNKEYVDETTKSNIIAASVIIEEPEGTSIFGRIKEVYRDTDLGSQPIDPVVDPLITQIASGFKKIGDYENLQSVIYEAEGSDPSTSTKKQAEVIPSSDKRVIRPGDAVISSVQSANTFKSAMKKDTISIDFRFHSYLNDKNERIVETLDSVNAPKRLPSDSVTVIKSQIRISSEIRIPVDSEHDMSIQIKKVNANRRVSLSESGIVNVIDHGRVEKQRSPVQCSDAETRSSEVKAEGRKDNIHESDATADRFLDYYEKELLPLQLTIKNLRDEIDFLATQQTMFKDKLYCPNKSKLPRLVHSNKKCVGCVRK